MTDSGATWTEERVEMLKKLWSEGLSASQIAAEIGSVTRNAVIGKVHRLGLSGRGKAKSASPQRAKKSPRTPSAPIALPQPVNRSAGALNATPMLIDREPLVAMDDVVVPISERVTIMDLRESMCRWPMGDPTKQKLRESIEEPFNDFIDAEVPASELSIASTDADLEPQAEEPLA